MEHNLVALSVLRTFSPLDGLKRENLGALARKTRVREVAEGSLLFLQGEQDRHSHFLVRGEVELLENGQLVSVLVGGSPEARFAIAEGRPRRFTARARTPLQYLVVENEALDVLIVWDQTGVYEVEEIQVQDGDQADDGQDWMTALLQSKAFHRIPASHVQALFMRMERVNLNAGDVVLRQGDEGDYFYVVMHGRCVVTRETPLNRDGIRLAELGPGDTFGEEALVADSHRNATVSMATDGALMRLAKADFQSLLHEPLLQWLGADEAKALTVRGACWLDVRLPSESENAPLPGAVNIPLYFLRMKLRQLDRAVPYILFCESGKRSSAGAYLLAERGFDAYVLRGGLASMGPVAA
jgi:CRP-like cAMP-binding protein